MSLTALCEAGYDGRQIEQAMAWLLAKQVTVPGDWSDRSPELVPGGWAFQYENARYPDVDDTAKVLMSLFRAGALERPEYREQIERAVNWVLGMQSSDGGWGAFDINNNRYYLNDIPFADHGALLDPGTADLTGRCIELLGMLGHGPDYPPVARAIAFIKKEQEPFGGWFRAAGESTTFTAPGRCCPGCTRLVKRWAAPTCGKRCSGSYHARTVTAVGGRPAQAMTILLWREAASAPPPRPPGRCWR